jgi:CRISPR-associated protein (TIGR02584 family)
MQHIFIGLCGDCPAAITQSLYTLIKHNEGNVPDKIIIITTVVNAENLKAELFDSGIWERFRIAMNIAPDKLQFGVSDKYIRQLPDLFENTENNNTGNNRATTDYILNILQQFSENPETKITFSVSDGDASMVAIGALSMALLGRRQDCLSHFNIAPPFDEKTINPKFYYPDSTTYELQNGESISGNEAKLNLSEIPFTRCRYLFNDRLTLLPDNFTDAVDLINGKIAENLDAPELYIKPDTLQCFISDIEINLNVAELTLYWLLALRCKNSCSPIHGQTELLDEFHAFAETINSGVMPDIIQYEHFKNKTSVELSEIISAIVSKIKVAVAIDRGRNFCLPVPDRGVYGLLLPPDNIICPRNY